MHGLGSLGRSLAAFADASPTPHGPEYLYLAAHVVIDHLADEHEALITGVWGLKALEAGVVRLYGVVWCCREGNAGWRYSVLVHRTLLLWAVPRGVSPPPGLLTLSTATLSHVCLVKSRQLDYHAGHDRSAKGQGLQRG